VGKIFYSLKAKGLTLGLKEALSYGHDLAFFLVPFGFEISLNADGGFMGLFNTTTMVSSSNQIVHVEFDSLLSSSLFFMWSLVSYNSKTKKW
jgi:hypothetical protein